MKPGRKTIAILLLVAGLILVNYLAASLPFRIDATAERIYTLSPGTRALLAKVRDPMTLELYFSRGASGLPVAYKNYAERVTEMLRQYARASGGRITLSVVDPEPDTPQEEKAVAAGLEPQRMEAGGEPFYLGLVATQAEQQRSIPSLNPDREQFLEYDLSELVYRTQAVDKKKLGLLTSLPLQGVPGNPMAGQADTEGQYVITQWQDTFDITPVDASAQALPPGLDALAIVHPENVAPALQYAIDQFLLSGKPVFLAVDPSSQYFKRQAGGQMAMMGGPPQNLSSDLPVLLSGWGIAYDPQKVVGDNEEATQVQTSGQSVARYPVWLSLQRENFNAKAPATAQLSSMLLVEPGSIAPKAGSSLLFTPLVQTSAAAGEVDAVALQAGSPEDVGRRLVPAGRRTLAALVSGRFPSAFPDGPPKDAKVPAAGRLTASRAQSTLLIVADTDWLFDDYSVRKFNFLGTTAAEPLNDNLAFAANALDFLSGSQDLISIRGKGDSVRPFTVFKRMEARASEKYNEKLAALEARLNEVQARLSELQGKKADGGKLLASPEIAKAIEDFQKQEASLSAERRTIRHALREDIEALQFRLLAANLLASPLLVCAFGLWFYRNRRKG
jgi:ABC-type uncharacterized transport system involved in gliding motility auxiliary subunit